MSHQHPDRPNAILTFCAGYDLSQVGPFVRSWQNCVPTADLFVFFTNLKQEVMDRLTAEGVRFVDIEHVWPTPYHPMILRFFLYRDFLTTHAGKFEKVLLTDIRDVVFQADPFSLDWRSRVAWASEDKPIRADPNWNTKWIIELFGSAVFGAIADKMAICAGTTLGFGDGIADYLRDLCALMEKHTYNRAINYDQGFHNYLVNFLAPSYGSVDFNFQLFATLGTVASDRIAVSKDRILLDGKVAPIVHQWDRHPAPSDFITASDQFRLGESR